MDPILWLHGFIMTETIVFKPLLCLPLYRTVRVWLKRDSGLYWPSICHTMPGTHTLNIVDHSTALPFHCDSCDTATKCSNFSLLHSLGSRLCLYVFDTPSIATRSAITSCINLKFPKTVCDSGLCRDIARLRRWITFITKHPNTVVNQVFLLCR